MLRRACPALLPVLLLLWANAWAGGLPDFSAASVPVEPEYALAENWLAQPETVEYPVDVFWVYPTILMDDTHWLMPVDDASLQARAAHTIVSQASVFTGQANLYAPLYRQMNLAGLSRSPEFVDQLLSYGMADVWQAFQYYLAHLNGGRPFILAGHSQGSNVLMQLAIDHWGTTGAEDRLVAAYIIGWSITPEDLEANPNLTLCGTAGQTGCFITYNSVAAGRQHVAPTIKPGTYVTNPLTWRTDGSFAPASLNSGAVFFMEDGSTRTEPAFTSAQGVDSGLVVQPKDASLVTSDMAAFPEGVYHAFDYSLFHTNIKTNAAQRISAHQSR